MFQRHEIEALLLTREEPLKEHLLYFSNWESKYCVPLRVSEGIFSKLDIKNHCYTLMSLKEHYIYITQVKDIGVFSKCTVCTSLMKNQRCK